MAGPELSYIWKFHWVRGQYWMSNIGRTGAPPPPPSPPGSYAPAYGACIAGKRITHRSLSKGVDVGGG